MPMPEKVAPMLATAGTMPVAQDQWAFEIKWDGVRAVSYIRDGRIHMESRNLLDITPRYPEVHGIAADLGVDAVLDGEVVAFDDDGRPSFQRLQGRMHVGRAADVAARSSRNPVAYLVFDVLWIDGRSTVGLPYTERRAILDGLREQGSDARCWQIPAAHVGEGDALLAAAKAQRLEGIVAKKLDSLYEVGRRSRCWLKLKNQGRQEVVVGGWLPGSGNRSGRIGALLVGYYEDDGTTLRYAGRVGTGFTDKLLREMQVMVEELARPSSPFADHIPERAARFVDPRLVAEVEFTEWTDSGTMRHPSFKGFRDDKPASAVRREPLPRPAG